MGYIARLFVSSLLLVMVVVMVVVVGAGPAKGIFGSIACFFQFADGVHDEFFGDSDAFWKVLDFFYLHRTSV